MKLCKREHASSILPGGRSKYGNCKECQRVWEAEQGPRKRIYDHTRYAKNREYFLAKGREYRARYPEKVREAAAKKYAKHPEGKAARNAWKRNNPGRVGAYNKARKARKLEQTCTCCTLQDFVALYVWASELGCEVDHIVPLRLGGRHCLKNLQPLTAEDHKEKTKRDVALIAKHKRQEKL